MSQKKRKVATFSKVMTEQETEQEKRKDTALGKSLKGADREYAKRRRK